MTTHSECVVIVFTIAKQYLPIRMTGGKAVTPANNIKKQNVFISITKFRQLLVLVLSECRT